VPPAESRGAPDTRRVFLECTSSSTSRYNTGIQRAGRNLVNASLAAPGPWLCTAIVYNGRYFEAIDGLPARAAPARNRTESIACAVLSIMLEPWRSVSLQVALCAMHCIHSVWNIRCVS
jgi:hypothetical protein